MRDEKTDDETLSSKSTEQSVSDDLRIAASLELIRVSRFYPYSKTYNFNPVTLN